MKAAKPAGLMSQLTSKPGEGAPRAPLTSKPAPNKAGQKPREPKKKTPKAKPSAKN
ncbi:hypothetical protein FCM35_KLT15818 [Carex littledalei]|uniref:Uncharacterized protein n=1 Tax=Carex littledalei TaxID=544730 RepID=A0A833VH42_9POAL|nr:hypothetical protein FCM35_KLT15818 [Carex littledalei]